MSENPIEADPPQNGEPADATPSASRWSLEGRSAQELLRQIPFDRLNNHLGDLVHLAGERALALVVQIVAMVMTERAYGPEGLGIYAYLASVYLIAAALADMGVPRWVENRMGDGAGPAGSVLADGLAAAAAAGLAALTGLMVMDLWGFEWSRIREGGIGYGLIGAAVLLRNVNGVLAATLNGQGRHRDAAKLSGRRKLLFLGILLVLLFVRVPPSLLMIAFFASEAGTFLSTRKQLPIPGPGVLWAARSRVRSTLTASRRFLLADDVLDVVFYSDFLILGLYVPAGRLGVYAQAMILVRLFLIIPMALAPILRRRYLRWAATGRLHSRVFRIEQTTRLLFFWHGLLALYLLGFFPSVVHWLLKSDYLLAESFLCFEMILPGLLFFAPLLAQEPFYEALDRIDAHRRLVFKIAALNLGLNLCLVPFAGILGASAATALSMAMYFLVFGLGSGSRAPWRRLDFLPIPAAVYLVFILERGLGAGSGASALLVPVAFTGLLWLSGYFFRHSVINPTDVKGEV